MALTLEEQRSAFASRRLTAMPIAGTIAWCVAGVCGALMTPTGAVWGLFFATGSIVYLGIFVSRFTGEDFLDRSKPKNVFDSLFFSAILEAVLVYAIAIPFFLRDYTSLPLSVGILSGLMWAPLSWIIEHWIGFVHAVGRTVLVVAVWYIFPTHRFVVVPIVIVAVYIFTIAVLETRWRRV
ncbi:MAG: hypothetical protein ABI282_11565 [Candidatus Baltobacteraceae bacterium]